MQNLLAILLLGAVATVGFTTEANGMPAAEEVGSDRIAWHDGSIEDAFDEAALQHKPLLLYWGAEWCPPCNELKRTIFRRPEFIARTRDFVPVHLDGDSERAQRWGEYFGLTGYPTVVILAPDRRELTRIPGDLDIGRYAAILDSVRHQLAPVRDLVAKALTDPSSLGDSEWRTLAYYAWDEDESRTVKDEQLADTLQRLAGACPPRFAEAASRLLFAWLVANAGRSPGERVTLDDKPRGDALARVQAVVADPVLARANASELIWSAPELIGGLTPPNSPVRTTLVKAWTTALDRLAADTSLSTMPRLATVYSRLSIFRLDHADAPIPPDLVALAKSQVVWADRLTTEPHERQSVINAAQKVLVAAGLNGDAEKLLTAELQRSPAPFYFMADLADLAQQTGDKKKALDWLKRAYDSSTGPATRFQWGLYYVEGLIDMTPEDKAGIEATTAKLLGELDRHPDALHQRTQVRFKKLDKRLSEWGAQHDAAATLRSLRREVLPICAKLPAADKDSKESCDSFLASSSAH